MDKDITSEEKLLKLIRKKNDKHNDDIPENDREKESQPSKKKSIALQFKKRKQVVDLLKLSNMSLSVVIILLAVYFAKFYFFDLEKEIQIPDIVLAEQKDVQKKETVVQVRPFELYEVKFEERDIFENPWDATVDANNPLISGGPNSDNSSDTNTSKQLKLVGIVLDKNPKAIIEDLQSKETLFLSLGERQGNVVVEDIQEDKVILKLNGETIELTP